MQFLKHLESFRDNLSINNFSDRTIEKYYSANKAFLSFIEKYYTRIDSIEKITKDIVLDYQRYLTQYKTKKGQHLTNSTKSNKLIAIKQFSQFLAKNDYILNNPTKDISLPKTEKTMVRDILSKDEVHFEIHCILKF